MTQPPCVRCERPVHDMAYVCARCARSLTVALLRAATHAREATTTVTRMDRIRPGLSGRQRPAEAVSDAEPAVLPAHLRDGHDPGALEAQPLPLNLDAANGVHAVRNTVVTWARHVADERGLALPLDPLPAVLCWLAGQTGWLRQRPEAAECFDELHDACALIWRLVDAPPPRNLVGACPCGTHLYAVLGRPAVTCQGCGTTYDVARSRELLLDHVYAMSFTAADCATLAVHLGLAADRFRTRKLVNKLAFRGDIDTDEQGQHPLVQVVAVLTERMQAA